MVELTARSIAFQIASQAWCKEETKSIVMDPALAEIFARIVDKLLDGAEEAFAIIANAHDGDWLKANDEWQQAAVKWRDKFFNAVMSGELPE